MKTSITIFSLAAMLLMGCGDRQKDEAQKLYSEIEQLYAEGKYNAAIDSVRALRTRYPKAIELRKKALAIFQDATMKMAQAGIAATDSAMQAVESQLGHASNIAERNRLKAKYDSLKVSYDTQCAVVRAVRKRQAE